MNLLIKLVKKVAAGLLGSLVIKRVTEVLKVEEHVTEVVTAAEGVVTPLFKLTEEQTEKFVELGKVVVDTLIMFALGMFIQGVINTHAV